jgi:hypothetical protein
MRRRRMRRRRRRRRRSRGEGERMGLHAGPIGLDVLIYKPNISNNTAYKPSVK